MQKGIIVKLLDYYLKNSEFEGAIQRAMEEFFEVRAGQKEALQILEEETALFNEWLAYDFILKNGNILFTKT